MVAMRFASLQSFKFRHNLKTKPVSAVQQTRSCTKIISSDKPGRKFRFLSNFFIILIKFDSTSDGNTLSLPQSLVRPPLAGPNLSLSPDLVDVQIFRATFFLPKKRALTGQCRQAGEAWPPVWRTVIYNTSGPTSVRETAKTAAPNLPNLPNS